MVYRYKQNSTGNPAYFWETCIKTNSFRKNNILVRGGGNRTNIYVYFEDSPLNELMPYDTVDKYMNTTYTIDTTINPKFGGFSIKSKK